MIIKKRSVKILTALCAAATLVVSLVSCNSNKAVQGKPIQGVTAEKYKESFERLPVKILTIEEISKKWPRDNSAAGPAPAPKPVEKDIPAIYIANGKYMAKESKTSAVTAGKIEDSSATGVKIAAEGSNIGGVYVKGEGSEYTLSDATIELSGDIKGMGGITAGAAADDHGTLTLKNVNITVNGSGRNTVSSTNNGTLKVYNSTLIGHDAPFDLIPIDDPSLTGASKYLEIQGNSRTTITMQNSYSYFYDSTITADGWGALSTDAGGEFVYMEANNCVIKTYKSGYGAYADLLCHDTFNNCDFDVASMAIVVAGAGDATFKDTKAKCGTYFALSHCVTGSPTEIATLNVKGGEISCKKPAVLIRSHNVDVNFDGVKLVAESGILIKTMVNTDPNATPTDGLKVYGVHATFKDMDVAGDIIHEDTARIMSVDLKSTTLSGAINNAYVTMDAASKWTATADSNITIVGSFDGGQIDAPQGVTITAVGGENKTYKLISGGTLILKVS